MVEQENTAGLLCLHDPALALNFCEQIVILKEGRVVRCLHPKKDSIMDIEEAFKQIYSNVSMVEHEDKKGKKHLIMLWED